MKTKAQPNKEEAVSTFEETIARLNLIAKHPGVTGWRESIDQAADLITAQAASLAESQAENAELKESLEKLRSGERIVAPLNAVHADAMVMLGERYLNNGSLGNQSVAELARKLAAAEEDVKRLDWMEKRGAEEFSDGGFGDGPSTWIATTPKGNINDTDFVCHQGLTIRAAIDAAKAATP